MLSEFTPLQLLFTCLLFVWAGFVRSGLGFGGAALALPLMLLVHDQPLFWLPMIGFHLLFFSGLTLRTRIHNVDWVYLKQAARFVVPAALVGVFGLISLPNHWLVIFIYAVTLFYGLLWSFNLELQSNKTWLDGLFLILGGYVAGISLSGAPLMVAVFMRNIARHQLRNTMFVLWFSLVSIKLTTLATLGFKLYFLDSMLLIPVAAIGHLAGLKVHDYILQNDRRFKQVIGVVLSIICLFGLWHIANS
ncbi:MAG: TSUP family transporter [Gammaproteobacteria bacterium]|nr:TSUP family transporter [Gammaproteobacteria bacterium]MDH5653793.1 TSUP family transporter [Gammaproteobacteria bacterium]